VGRRIALFGLAVLALSCGSRVAYGPATPRPADQPLNVQAPFEDTWNAVIQTFFDRNIPVRTLEKASGLLESDELRAEIGRDCDCGTWLGVPIAGYGAYGGDAYYRFRVLVKSGGDRESSLVLRSSCRAKIDRIEGELVCQLIPAKEAEIKSAIADRVAAPARRTP
ncbi:MAG: hypothetical protein ACREQ9_19855, partial [Candidatus Binatia bacterium]